MLYRIEGRTNNGRDSLARQTQGGFEWNKVPKELATTKVEVSAMRGKVEGRQPFFERVERRDQRRWGWTRN